MEVCSGSGSFFVETVPRSERVTPPPCLRCFLEFNCSNRLFNAPLPGLPGTPRPGGGFPKNVNRPYLQKLKSNVVYEKQKSIQKLVRTCTKTVRANYTYTNKSFKLDQANSEKLFRIRIALVQGFHK